MWRLTASIIGLCLCFWLSFSQAAEAKNELIPAEILQAKKDCRAYNAEACDKLTRYLDGLAKQMNSADPRRDDIFKMKIDWAMRGCKVGAPYGCEAAGWALEHGQESRRVDHAAAYVHYRLGCEAGSALSCNNAGLARLHKRGADYNLYQANEYFRRACDLGYKDACGRAPKVDESGFSELDPGLAAFAANVRTALDKNKTPRSNCNDESVTACSEYVAAEQAARNAATHPTERAKHGRGAIWGAKIGCEAGSIELCHFAGRASRYGLVGIVLSEDGAKWAYRQACSLGDESACGLVDAPADASLVAQAAAERARELDELNHRSHAIRVEYDGTPQMLSSTQCQQLDQSIADQELRTYWGLSDFRQSQAMLDWRLEYEQALEQKRACPPARFTWPPEDGDQVSVQPDPTLPDEFKRWLSTDLVAMIDRGAYEHAYRFAVAQCGGTSQDGNRQGCFAKGWLSEHGLGTGRSTGAALVAYERAGRNGNPVARMKVSEFHYRGLATSRNLWIARPHAAKLCKSGDGQACAHYHRAVLETDERIAGRPAVYEAADFYAFRCLSEPISLEACANLSVIHAYPKFGVQDIALAKRFAAQACQGGIETGCAVQSEILLKEASDRAWQEHQLRTAYSEQRGGIGQFLQDLAYGIANAQVEASPYVRSMDSSPASSGSNSWDSVMAAQDWRNFNNAVRATNNIGSGYNSNCPASNPYC